MSNPKLPQAGWYTEDEWAESFQEEVRSFREKCKKYGVPRKKWGKRLVVSAEDLYRHMPSEGESDGEEAE